MQQQYWVTKKSVLRKLGGKEDECIVSSDAELDAKLELFKSVNDSCVQLQRVIDLYQERLCYLAQEENTLGRYLKECGKNEKNASAGQIMATAGKALAYVGHQRLTVRPPLVRLHHEVETFRAQAVSDTRLTVTEMEKARTEYRAALSWIKSASAQLDPDTGHGLDRFRKAQSYVKTSKVKFDRYTLACLQKVDLLAAARCNMFSHALVSYQNALQLFASKSSEILTTAAGKLNKVEPYEFNIVSELAHTSDQDKDKNTFFNAEYSDKTDEISAKGDSEIQEATIDMPDGEVSTLLGEDFLPTSSLESNPANDFDESKPSSALLDLNWSPVSDFLGNSSFMPSSLIEQGSFKFSEVNKDITDKQESNQKPNKTKTDSQVSWLSLFAELDPLASGVMDNNVTGDRA
ncbi:islet cell autoantigen 1 [Cylas formicarius]|uniref:islet cell autoantigen 1 n=1 Tax=Cylas formicarius TaxID=197179 RepID=UPI0029588AA5|nr:islet cell autoantigen 1 [Cylas formicarius]